MLYLSSNSVIFFIVMLLAVVFNLNILKNFFQKDIFSFESSVWCTKTLNHTKICKFKNVCYDLQLRTFLFYLGNQTVVKGLSHYSDFQKLQLSSIDSHNQFYANFSIVESVKFKDNQIEFYNKALLFSRFKPNNIMHVFHDDLFPVFLTLEFICSGNAVCIKSYVLLIHDHYPKGSFFNLYEIFSIQSPILLNSLPLNSKNICFKELVTGLVQDSIFYQYGFKKPQGPVRPLLCQNDVTRFTTFVKTKLKIKDEGEINIALIQRLKSRKILNIEKVQHMTEKVLKKILNKPRLNFFIIDLKSNDTATFINIVSQTDVLLGMHGAEMIFSLFMKPKSIVIELFPFGIQPNIVSFITFLSQIENSNIKYIAWRNMLKNNSVSYPFAHPLFGGINHLNKSLQEKIKNTEEVPAVKCCHNPLYLYHMYQDTLVSNDFENFLNTSLAEHNEYLNEEKLISRWFYPSVVRNLSCKFQSDSQLLVITWKAPFNCERNIKYSLYIKDKKNHFVEEFVTENVSLKIKIPKINNPEFQIWISAHFSINHSKSKDLYFECK